MKRGERIANKTNAAIKNALLELIQEKNYPDITVNELVERGDIGRSTLYKHYRSKADVLVDIHKDVFVHLFSGFKTRQAWRALTPPGQLIGFFEKYQKTGKNPFLLSYKLGSDLDYLMSNINSQLAVVVEEKLRSCFDEKGCTIALPLLAYSIANLYSGLIMSWFNKFQSLDSKRFATDMHRMTRALILEAFGKNN